MADEIQLGQLFQNLLGNAIKFRGQSPSRIHVFAKENNNEWQISVQDNGMGILPEYRDRVFLIFQRLHSAGDFPGTGIGLAICKRIVERHGGKIWLESPPEGGCIICFTLLTPS
jgi:light-regulated signal transduction histidine kinase (bacteriophytochrome)